MSGSSLDIDSCMMAITWFSWSSRKCLRWVGTFGLPIGLQWWKIEFKIKYGERGPGPRPAAGRRKHRGTPQEPEIMAEHVTSEVRLGIIGPLEGLSW